MSTPDGGGKHGPAVNASKKGKVTDKRRRKPKQERVERAAEASRQSTQAYRFPVVALGASAGGLNALEKFFGAVSPDFGMAYVVIQHLAPTQASMLTELLGRIAPLPIVEAKEGMKLQANHAYVIPPNHYMSIKHGELHLTERCEGHRLPIDLFLRELAVDQGENAFAVILSGTGSDGALGVQAVKGEGGVVVVQAPASAEYAGMPESAIATGQADFVLPPDEIPAALMGFRSSASVRAGAQGEETVPAERAPELPAIFALLRERKGHDFALYKISTVIRRVRRRMAVHGIEDYVTYLRFLREHGEELDKLYQELLIRVSDFFRDPEAFAALERLVIPRLFERRLVGEAVRVWVPGCSTGEEPYSIAMLLQEAMDGRGQRYPIQLFATDIDNKALETARAGRYPANIRADISPSQLRRFFVEHGGHYEIDKSLRQMVIFAEQSVIKDPPFSQVDLLSCRNLFIYMSSELQRRVLLLFHYALKPDGFLFLGNSESIGTADDLFEPLDGKHKIYVRRDDSFARAHFLGMPGGAGVHQRSAPRPEPGAARQKLTIGELAQRVVLRDCTPAFVVVDQNNEIVYFHGRTGRFLEPPSGVPNLDVLQMARTELRSPMRSVLHRVRKEGALVRGGAVKVSTDGRDALVRLMATPLSESDAPEGLALIQLEELGPVEEQAAIEFVERSAEESERVMQLEQELAQTKDALQTTIEELETANEELQSSNEELQSSNEELETSREELQSVNEELHTVNAELESKVEALSQVNDDVSNLLASTDLGIVFLDPEFRVQRFTQAATRVIPLIEADIGRPLKDLAHGLVYAEVTQDMEEVMRTLVPKERHVKARDNRWFLLRIRPYRTSDGRISGTVLAFFDVAYAGKLEFMTKLKDALAQSPTMVLLMDLEGRVEYASNAFSAETGLQPGAQPARILGESTSMHVSVDHAEIMRRTLRAGRTWRGTLRYLGEGNAQAEMQAFFAPIRSPEGKVTHAVVYLETGVSDAD